MTSREPLPFDPILRAAALWDERIGPSRTMAAVTSVMRVQQILLSAVDGALRPHGLTFARYEALVLLSFSRHGRLPMRVMGERLQLHPTSVTNIVDRLQADGLVRRVPHPTDRRATLVEITDGGRAALEDATKAVTDVDFGLSGLTPQEETQLTTLLSQVRHAAGDFAAQPDPAGGLILRAPHVLQFSTPGPARKPKVGGGRDSTSMRSRSTTSARRTWQSRRTSGRSTT